jgi:hypothetical protein
VTVLVEDSLLLRGVCIFFPSEYYLFSISEKDDIRYLLLRDKFQFTAGMLMCACLPVLAEEKTSSQDLIEKMVVSYGNEKVWDEI